MIRIPFQDAVGPNGKSDFNSYADALWWGVVSLIFSDKAMKIIFEDIIQKGRKKNKKVIQIV